MTDTGFQLAKDTATGKVVHIDDVDEGYEGCVCPDAFCESPVIACNYNPDTRKVVSYFRHAQIESACSEESALHQYAKNLIAGSHDVLLPAFERKVACQGAAGRRQMESFRAASSRLEVSSSAVEQQIRRGDITVQPDVVIVGNDGSTLAVEVHVTHQVDETKREKLEELAVDTIEVSLRSGLLFHAKRSRETLDLFILEEAARSWKVCHRFETHIVEFQRLKSGMLATAKTQAKRPGFMGGAKHSQRARLVKLKQMIAAYSLPESRAAAEAKFLRDLRTTAGPFSGLHSHWLGVYGGIPTFVDVPVAHELVFKCYRAVWQYHAIDLMRAFRDHPFDVADLVEGLFSVVPVQRIYDLAATIADQQSLRVPLPRTQLQGLSLSEYEALPCPHTAVSAYCKSLVQRGYLKSAGSDHYTAALGALAETLSPPDYSSH